MTALELRQIGLAERALQFLLDRGDDLFLRHLAVEAPQVPFDESEVAKFSATLILQSANY